MRRPSADLTARETAVLPDKREIPQTRRITYTSRDGRRVDGEFPLNEIVKCQVCNRNQPRSFVAFHMSWEHGINSEDGRITHPPAQHHAAPIPAQWQLERG